MRGKIIGVIAALLLSGCATVIEGTTQEITVITDPPGAQCVLTRHGEQLGAIASTPGTLKIDKTKHDIQISCHKDGYDDGTARDESDRAAASFGNMAAGRLITRRFGVGLIGHAVDSISGADNKYDSEVHVTLVKAAPEPTQ